MNNRHIIACLLNEYSKELKLLNCKDDIINNLSKELGEVAFWISMNIDSNAKIPTILEYCDKLSLLDCYHNQIEKIRTVLNVYQKES